ncbi:MAG: hypothetical protein WBF43_06875 [Methylocella sp.]
MASTGSIKLGSSSPRPDTSTRFETGHMTHKAGQLLTEMRENGERAAPGDAMSQAVTSVTLPNLGVSRMQSSRWQKLGAMDEAAFEARACSVKRQAVASVDATASERAARC